MLRLFVCISVQHISDIYGCITGAIGSTEGVSKELNCWLDASFHWLHEEQSKIQMIGGESERLV